MSVLSGKVLYFIVQNFPCNSRHIFVVLLPTRPVLARGGWINDDSFSDGGMLWRGVVARIGLAEASRIVSMRGRCKDFFGRGWWR